MIDDKPDEWLHYGAIGILQSLGWGENWWDCEVGWRDGAYMVKVGAEQVVRYRAWEKLPPAEQEAALVYDITPDGDADGHDQEARDAE